MRFIVIVFIIFSIAVLFGCSKGRKGVYHSPLTENRNTIRNLFGENDLRCANEKSCSESVGKTIVVTSLKKTRECLSFLVSPRVLAISSSCLESDFPLQNMDCSKKIHTFFPKTRNHPAEDASCSQILKITDVDTHLAPTFWRDDYAFIKLDRDLNRDHLELDINGVKDAEDLTGWYLSKDKNRSLLHSHTGCNPLFSSYINPNFDDQFDPSVVLGNCFVNGSMMGSPLVNSRGRVVAIASARLDRATKEGVVRRFVGYGRGFSKEEALLMKQELDESLSGIIFASNLTCIDVDDAGNSVVGNRCRKVTAFRTTFELKDNLERSRRDYVRSFVNKDDDSALCSKLANIENDITEQLDGIIRPRIFLRGADGKKIRTVCSKGSTEVFSARITVEPDCFIKGHVAASSGRKVIIPRVGMISPLYTHIGVKLNSTLKLETFVTDSSEETDGVRFLYRRKSLSSGIHKRVTVTRESYSEGLDQEFKEKNYKRIGFCK